MRHTIRRGETIYSIARRYSVSVETLIDINDIDDPTSISVGTVLLVPGQYTVKRGDTYYGIARRYGISVEELLEINGRSQNTVLRVGDYLYVPQSAETIASSSQDASEPVATPSGFPRVAATVDPGEVGRQWPHPGRRARMDGKLPGIVIEGQEGDPVWSISSGRVIYAGPYSAFGRVVFVQNADGYIYVYGGNDDLTVSVGDFVTPGTELGILGAAVPNQRANLFFSVWKNNRFIDPNGAPRG
jgi:murein DD-endopeptidase MepM/ murein hydrolase activator NlpD